MHQHSLKKQLMKGFTLVELLIVVIILAILAAIVVPQFASTTDDARESSLDTTLGNMRAAIDLYQQQHAGRYPGAYTTAATPVATTSDAERLTAFTNQLTLYTTAAGSSSSTVAAGYRFGPYLKKSTLPVNPITTVGTIEFVITGALGMTGTAPNGGWKFDLVSGQFIANDTSTDLGGVNAYDTH